MEREELANIENLLKNNKISYRQGVIAIIQNNNNKYLIVQSNNFQNTEWKFPSGGLQKDETHEEGLLRELNEEFGTNLFKIIKQSTIVNSYDWTTEYILAQYNKNKVLFKGQQQVQFLVKFIGKDEDIILDKEELGSHKWVSKEELKSHFIFKGQYDQALKSLNDLGL